MTKKTQIVNHKELNYRLDKRGRRLFYKKYSKYPFTGIAEEYFDGEPQKKVSFKNGRPDGPYFYYNLKGKLIRKGFCKDGFFDGLCETKEIWGGGYKIARDNYKNGYLLKTTSFNNQGGVSGCYIPFESIKLKKQKIQNLNRMNYHDAVDSYLKKKRIFSNSYISRSTSILEWRVSVKDGAWKYFDENGNCKKREKYKNGRKVK